MPHLSTSFLRGAAFVAAAWAATGAHATEFAVSPIRVEFVPGMMSETIAVSNDAKQRLRVKVRLTEWTQDAQGKDVYTDSTDLIWFPRQMDVDPGARRLVRVGVKTPAGQAERAYRLYIDEEPDPSTTGGRAQVAFNFSFGVPIFVVPPGARAAPVVGEPTLAKGKLSLEVRNTGNHYFRLSRVAVTSPAGYKQELAGWYSLAGTARTYTVDIPADACRKAGTLEIKLEGETPDIDLTRRLNVDPANCP
jgi:fimbrial chaperone protein